MGGSTPGLVQENLVIDPTIPQEHCTGYEEGSSMLPMAGYFAAADKWRLGEIEIEDMDRCGAGQGRASVPLSTMH